MNSLAVILLDLEQLLCYLLFDLTIPGTWAYVYPPSSLYGIFVPPLRHLHSHCFGGVYGI